MSKVAKRYAQGLLNFSNEVRQTDVVFSEMKALVKIIDESKELNSFFQTPFIHFKKKIAVAGEIFGSFSSASQNLIKLVIKRGRGSYLKDIARVFIDKVEDLKGVQRVSLGLLAAPCISLSLTLLLAFFLFSQLFLRCVRIPGCPLKSQFSCLISSDSDSGGVGWGPIT